MEYKTRLRPEDFVPETFIIDRWVSWEIIEQLYWIGMIESIVPSVKEMFGSKFDKALKILDDISLRQYGIPLPE